LVVSARPPLSTLLADPGSVVLRTDLLRAGWPERLVDALSTTVEGVAGKRWLGSRVDISANTVRIHGDSLRRIESLIGTC
jgi:hypothetical protein